MASYPTRRKFLPVFSPGSLHTRAFSGPGRDFPWGFQGSAPCIQCKTSPLSDKSFKLSVWLLVAFINPCASCTMWTGQELA